MFIDLRQFNSTGSIEIFYVDGETLITWAEEGIIEAGEIESKLGYYYWFFFPCCLPDSDPIGPFSSFEKAYHDVVVTYTDEDLSELD